MRPSRTHRGCAAKSRNPNLHLRTGAASPRSWRGLLLCIATLEEIVEHREDLAPAGDLAHCKGCALRAQALVERPQRRGRGKRAPLVADLEIGEVLADRKDRAGEQPLGGGAVGIRVVAVGRLRRVDVPILRTVARRDDLPHRLERARHQRAARCRAAEEGLLVHLLGLVGVADEHDLDMAVAAREKDVEQHVEPLGEVLHVLGHRSGHVHQAEHDRLRYRLGHVLEAPIADVDRVDIGNPLELGRHRLGGGTELGALLLVLALGDLGRNLVDHLGARTAQRYAPLQCQPHGAVDRDVRWRARDRVAGATRRLVFGLGQAALGEIGQFEIVEEDIEEFLAGEDEAERILALPFARLLGTAAALVRARQHVAFQELLVAGQDVIVHPAWPAVEARLIHSIEWNADLAAL